MTDALNKFGEILVNNLTNAAWTDLIIYGIGFIGFCMLGSLLTRKDRKANPEKYARMSAVTATQNTPPVDNPMGYISTADGIQTYTRVGNVTYII